jgi:hypothetical protein
VSTKAGDFGAGGGLPAEGCDSEEF